MWWFMQSAGPEGNCYRTNNAFDDLGESPANLKLVNGIIYDATNGTTSRGAIFRAGGTPVGPAKVFYTAVGRSY